MKAAGIVVACLLFPVTTLAAEITPIGPPLGMELSALKKLKASDNPQARIICSNDNVAEAKIDGFSLSDILEMNSPVLPLEVRCDWFEPDGAGGALKLASVRTAGIDVRVTYGFKTTKTLFEPTLVWVAAAGGDRKKYKAVLKVFKSQLGPPTRHGGPGSDSGSHDAWNLRTGADVNLYEDFQGGGLSFQYSIASELEN